MNWWWRRRLPEEDPKAVGISFVDVLFALVVAEAFEPLRNFSLVPGEGLGHLAVTAVLVITSWVGYHNSQNRPTYFIRFPNLPLWQFVIDIALVAVYWLVAVSAEGASSTLATPPSEDPEAFLVMVSFWLYLLWDLVASQIRSDPRYAERRPAKYDAYWRRRVTVAGAVLATAYYCLTVWADPDVTETIVLADIGLIVLLVLYRIAKEAVPQPDRSELADTARSSPTS